MYRQSDSKTEDIDRKTSTEQGSVTAPAITLPKGGGAIRGIGEKFAANPVTGTGSLNVPVAMSPGRSGFGPKLSLSYDSGAGNGPFGLGWHLSLPSITRKTDKGLPRYHDAEESDVFILSGTEDLVPRLLGNGQPEAVPPRTVGGKTYAIRRYRPRIENLFARIERWTNQDDPSDSFWRSISKNNITTWYGKTPESRIFDPEDPSRIFSWLICENYDDKGNVIIYGFKKENSDRVDGSKPKVHERNRSHGTRRANRHIKRIRYGNRIPYFPRLAADQPWPGLPGDDEWLFEVVFDYGEHYVEDGTTGQPSAVYIKDDQRQWDIRQDVFSTYRAGFEVRTYRLCRRVLMFHHFESELGVPDYLVRATHFEYNEGPIASFITSVTQSGYKRQNDGTYLKKSLPPLEFEYSEATIQDKIHEIDEESLENLPNGLDGARYQWVDLDGEGLSGILTEQAGSWFYKPNLGGGGFGPVEAVAARPSLAALSNGRQQLIDLAGDGQLDVVEFDSPTPGFYERTPDEDWEPFRAFESLPDIDWQDPNLKFIDLTGDGHADILITEDEAFTWYRSLAETGFASGGRVRQALDEDKGPRLVFADGTQSIYLADFSGDGLADLVRIRNNGGVCYWPNLGYGRFGGKVTMDNSPHFDAPDQFDQRRIRLADIDGSGLTDIIYLKDDGVYIYLNHSGNRWADAKKLKSFPTIDNLSSVMTADLLGNGTTCLVWSSPLPGHARKTMRYIDLMGGQKPHLLLKSVNNLGVETHVHYAPSTKFYLADKGAGKPWITKIPFPVHVVERVETFDRISRNRFVTRYAYHHGYFDGKEREFRGFAMVEQWDTEEYAVLAQSQGFPAGVNIEESSHVPPVYKKTWFHTGAYLGRNHIFNFFAGLLDSRDTGEYYREPGLTGSQAKELLIEDTVLPAGLTFDEEREACRALKGSMLRQEVYTLDGTDKEPHPYTVTERNFTIRRLQPKADNRHVVFFTHARESISYHYERNPADPRVTHAMTLEVDDYGNVLKSLAIAYGRRAGQSPLSGEDKKKQEQTLITYTENIVTRAIDNPAVEPGYDHDNYRTPLPAESLTYEVTGYGLTGGNVRFRFDKFAGNNFQALGAALNEINYEEPTDYSKKQKRLIEHVRTLYRKDDLTALLPLGDIEPMALTGESHRLAFTPALAKEAFVDSGKLSQAELNTVLSNEGGYVHSEGDANWWIPSGRIFYSPGSDDPAAQESAYARQHFFLPHRYRDPFYVKDTWNTESFVIYDTYDLLVLETRDAFGNRVTAGTRKQDDSLDKHGIDYRVLQPRLMMDSNRNQTEVVFDTLGLVVGTAVMGKPEDNPKKGDVLDATFKTDLFDTDTDAFYNSADPHTLAPNLLKGATTRIVYDIDRYRVTRLANPEEPEKWEPVFAATLARETHVSDPPPPGGLKIQISFSCSDGFGREIQKKIQAEPGPVPKRDAEGKIIIGPDGRPEMTHNAVSPRWVGSGWTIFNNKGKPVRQYEPFFTDGHTFEFDVRIGVSPVLFYDPVGRVVATLHPNHTWEKVVFGPWRQETWDVSDTILIADPMNDNDAGYFFRRLPPTEYLPTWHVLRTDPAHAAAFASRYAKPTDRVNETRAAGKTRVHAATPTVAHADSLGRTFLTLAHNRFKRSDTPPADPPTEEFYRTGVIFDIEGNQRAVIDALSRTVMRYDYDMLGALIHQASMEAGERWTLNDVSGKPIRSWDSRDHQFKTEYDRLRRPAHRFVRGNGASRSDPHTLNKDVLFEKIIYGEGQANDIALNLRTRVYKSYDCAGVVFHESYDFKGNLLASSRKLAGKHRKLYDWKKDIVEPSWENFTSRTTYDALNRPLTATSPDFSVYRPSFNEANLLNKVEVNLRGAAASTPFVTNIDYDARGRRVLIDYGNGVRKTYEYDPLTFHLTHLLTRREATDFPNDCPEPPPAVWPGCEAQNLHYTYDPAGNITHIRDEAQQTIYFKNKRIEPSAEYTYDAIYRLIEATGREHLGQVGGAPVPHSYNDSRRAGIVNPGTAGRFNPGDGNAMGTYIERYLYDAVGNFLEMRHRGSAPAHPGWKRAYTYNEFSLLEPGKKSNRLTLTTVNPDGPAPQNEGYVYDPHGSMLKMPQLEAMQWNFRDELLMSRRQAINAQDNDGQQHKGERTYYVYDASGQRVRKVTELSNGNPKDERIYLGGFEIYRKHSGADAGLVRETLHIMDDKRRIALVETRNDVDDGTEKQLTRYQFGNHLGSAGLELDDHAKVISYEEYTPYGSTSYQAVRSQTGTPKRYRYTGMERDEETGLNYHTARYYAPWLGRWTAADKIGVKDGVNLYSYVSDTPINLNDPSGLQPPDSVVDRRNLIMMGHDPREVERIVAAGRPTLPPLPPRAVGALQVVGGGFEAFGAVVLLLTPEPTTATKVAGGALGLHSLDTLQAGTRTLWTGDITLTVTHDTGAAVALEAGASPETAQWAGVGADILMSVGPSALSSMGRSGVTSAAEVSAESGQASVSIAFKPGLPAGHNIVGVNTGSGTQWSHLMVGSVEDSSGVILSGEATVGAANAPNAAYTIVEVPVSAEGAQAALSYAEGAQGAAGSYSYLSNNCATYAADVLSEAGVTTPPLTTPLANLGAATLQTPRAASTLPVISAGVNATVAVETLVSEEPGPISSPEVSPVYDYENQVCY